MKKVLAIITVITLLFSVVTCFAEATNTEIKVILNGEEVVFDQGPILVNEKPMIPLRAVFEKMGASISWDNDTETVMAICRDTIVMLQIDNEKMFKLDEAIVLETPAMLVNDRTLIPIHAISDVWGSDIEWNRETNEVLITDVE